MDCWKCRKKISDEAGPIGYRAQCPHCDIDLHACLNCRFYTPGKPNDCAVPGTDWVKDRERMNLCDEFEAKKEGGSVPPPTSKKKGFDSLFKDET
jgi:hypothetical protein